MARADELADRHIVQGELGCPICDARYLVSDGVADFSAGSARSRVFGDADGAGLRAAALLGLTEPGGLVVLAGEWSAGVLELLGLTENVQLLAINYAEPLRSGGALSLALVGESSPLPLARSCARGIALDRAHSTPAILESAGRSLAPGGRLLAPASAPNPLGLQELAHDSTHRVAASTTTTSSAPVGIAHRR